MAWIFWAAWAIIGIGAELAYAIFKPNKGDTLSENYWKLDKLLSRWPWARIPVHIITIGGALLVAIHLIWGVHL